MWSYADRRRECITFTLCIVQFYYVNSLLLLLLSWTWPCVSACACVCTLVFVCTWLQAGLLYMHLHFILSFWICHKSTCRIRRFCAAAHASMCACEFVCLSVIGDSTQGHLEQLWETKDVNNALKYWWLPLETCMPYAKLLHCTWLTTPIQ